MKYFSLLIFCFFVSCAQNDSRSGSSGFSMSANSAGLKRYMALIKNDSITTYFEIKPAAGMPRRPQKVGLKAFYLMSVNLENLLTDALAYNPKQLIVDDVLKQKKYDVMWKENNLNGETAQKFEARLLDSLQAKKTVECGEREIVRLVIKDKSALTKSERQFPVNSIVKHNALFEGYTIEAMVKELNRQGLDLYTSNDTSKNLYDFDINLGTSEEIIASLSKIGIIAQKEKANVEIYHFIAKK